MDPQQLREAIDSARAGRGAGFEAILNAYGQRLYGYFFRISRRHHDAEDMLGELMLRLVRQLKNYEHRGRFEPWLFRIAANMVRDRMRRAKTRPAPASMSAEDESGLRLTDRLPGAQDPADANLLAAEAAAELNEALDKLDETTRQMILLRHFGEMSFKEIAGLLGCPLGTVLARVHRGLRSLRGLMAGNDESE